MDAQKVYVAKIYDSAEQKVLHESIHVNQLKAFTEIYETLIKLYYDGFINGKGWHGDIHDFKTFYEQHYFCATKPEHLESGIEYFNSLSVYKATIEEKALV